MIVHFLEGILWLILLKLLSMTNFKLLSLGEACSIYFFPADLYADGMTEVAFLYKMMHLTLQFYKLSLTALTPDDVYADGS